MTHRQHIAFFTQFSTMICSAVLATSLVARAEDTVPTAPTPAPAAPAAQPAEVAKPAETAKAAEPAKTDSAAKPAEAVASTEAVAVQQVVTSDPYGFTAWLNSVRAQYGLRAVGYDPNLSAWAAVNNQHQASRGIGHFVMGPARRQNSAMGHYSSIGAMWLASPAHAAALLDPSISYIGIAGYGAYWTFNAY